MNDYKIVLLIVSIVILAVSCGASLPMPKCTLTACTPELTITVLMIGFGFGLLAMFTLLYMEK